MSELSQSKIMAHIRAPKTDQIKRRGHGLHGENVKESEKKGKLYHVEEEVVQHKGLRNNKHCCTGYGNANLSSNVDHFLVMVERRFIYSIFKLLF